MANIRWKGFSKGKLADHYKKHGKEFGSISQIEYLKKAKEFAAEPGLFEQIQVGNMFIRHDPDTGRVFIGNVSDREIRTFYIADKRGTDAFGDAVRTAREIIGT